MGHNETHNAHAGSGPVLVDIGDGTGALVLHTEPDLAGAEIEISPVGHDDRRSHVAVHARPVPGGTLHAAVYPSLPAGTWQLWDPHTNTARQTVTITDGEVTQAHWA
jgi:hypothetical protein